MSEALSTTSVIRRGDEIIESEIDGEVVALNVEEGTCFGLNKVGSRIWKLIANPVSVEEVKTTLVSEYAVDEATCERQVLELLEELRAGRLIEVGDWNAMPDTLQP